VSTGLLPAHGQLVTRRWGQEVRRRLGRTSYGAGGMGASTAGCLCFFCSNALEAVRFPQPVSPTSGCCPAIKISSVYLIPPPFRWPILPAGVHHRVNLITVFMAKGPCVGSVVACQASVPSPLLPIKRMPIAACSKSQLPPRL
jgi:hypothetical protein